MIKTKALGADKVRAKNANRIRALSSDGQMGRMVTDLGLQAHRLLRANVHKDTRALWQALTIEVKRNTPTDVVAVVYVDPVAMNPRSKGRPYIYAKFENARGGAHAFFDKTARQMRHTEAVAIRELTRVVVDGTLT